MAVVVIGVGRQLNREGEGRQVGVGRGKERKGWKSKEREKRKRINKTETRERSNRHWCLVYVMLIVLIRALKVTITSYPHYRGLDLLHLLKNFTAHSLTLFFLTARTTRGQLGSILLK